MANTYKRTIVLGLDYSEFSGGISECNRKMGLLDAEMKLAKEQANAYGDATDQLKVKQAGLAQKINLQKKIVEQQADAYDKAMSAAKKNEKQIDSLDKALLISRTTLQKLENEYSAVNKELEEMDDNTKDVDESQRSFGDTIRDVSDFIGVSTNPVVEKLAEHFDNLDSRVGAAILTTGTLVTTLGGLTMKTAEHAKEITNVSQTMGMTTDQYQVWDYILKSVGYDAESASGDLAALAEKAKDAAEGGNDSAKTFRMLGISVKDSSGNLKSQNQLFTELVFALRDMEDITTRNAIASDLLSTTGEKLVPVLNMSKDEFIGLKNEAYETGYVMRNDLLQNASKLDDEMQEMNRKFEAVKMQLGVALLPVLTILADIIGSIPTPVWTAISVFSILALTIGSLSKAFLAYQTQALLGATANMMLGTTGAVATASLGPMLLILLGIAAAIALIVGGVSAVKSAMDEVKRTGNDVINASQRSGQVSRPKYNARGTEYYEGGETWVGEHGPELVQLPRGSRIYNHSESRKQNGGNTYIFQIDSKNVKEFNRLVEMAEKEQVAIRTGVSKI